MCNSVEQEVVAELHKTQQELVAAISMLQTAYDSVYARYQQQPMDDVTVKIAESYIDSIQKDLLRKRALLAVAVKLLAALTSQDDNASPYAVVNFADDGLSDIMQFKSVTRVTRERLLRYFQLNDGYAAVVDTFEYTFAPRVVDLDEWECEEHLSSPIGDSE